MATWSLPDALELLKQQYPGAFVTSGARDPNSALGKANPRSYHNVGEAFDIRPMPGVSFQTYVNNLKAAGLPVVEALDEAKNPKSWTTGPNWHIAFSGNKQVASNPIDIIRRAQAFNVNIPQEQMPPAGGPMSAAPQAPAFDLQAALQQMAAQKLPLEQRKKIPTWAAILGVLGDSYSGAHGRGLGFAEGVQKQNEAFDERNFEREKLNAQIQNDQVSLAAKLAEQPQFIQNLQAYQAMPPSQKRAYLQYLDATQPITVAMPQGPQYQSRTQTKVVNGKTYYNIGGDWYEEGE